MANPLSIAELAYQLYEARGRQDGHHLEDWLEAERRIQAIRNQTRGPATPKSVPPLDRPPRERNIATVKTDGVLTGKTR